MDNILSSEGLVEAEIIHSLHSNSDLDLLEWSINPEASLWLSHAHLFFRATGSQHKPTTSKPKVVPKSPGYNVWGEITPKLYRG